MPGQLIPGSVTAHLNSGSGEDDTLIVLNISQFNLLTPNVNYSGHTALLNSKVAFYIFIQQI